MKKSTSTVFSSSTPSRFTVHQRTHVVAIHDTTLKVEHRLYSYGVERHNHPWIATEVDALADWLNERAAGYPRNLRIDSDGRVKGVIAASSSINEPPWLISEAIHGGAKP